MADDPRAWRPVGQLYVPPEPPVDPLRALLADEDRAVELFRSRGLTKNQAWRVLAALREVADDQSPAGSRGYAAEARRG